MKTEMKIFAAILLSWLALPVWGQATKAAAADNRPEIKSLLMIGDSMTGYLGDRLNAYGKQNGFEVSTVVWDGSTIKKWAENPKLGTFIKQYKPDAIFISLGMNDLFEANPKRLEKYMEAIKAAAGNIPIVWVGPPSWPGYKKGEVLNKWLAEQMGEGHFYRSFDLTLPRQSKTNPHPTRQGMIKWTDALVQWVQKNGAVRFPGIAKPTGQPMVRGKNFVYRRMKEKL